VPLPLFLVAVPILGVSWAAKELLSLSPHSLLCVCLLGVCVSLVVLLIKMSVIRLRANGVSLPHSGPLLQAFNVCLCLR
jgi:hypothetical protein